MGEFIPCLQYKVWGSKAFEETCFRTSSVCRLRRCLRRCHVFSCLDKLSDELKRASSSDISLASSCPAVTCSQSW